MEIERCWDKIADGTAEGLGCVQGEVFPVKNNFKYYWNMGVWCEDTTITELIESIAVRPRETNKLCCACAVYPF